MSDENASDGRNGQKRGRGRPPAEAGQRRDQNITFRTTPEIKEQLEALADSNGRTVSQEIEFWLRLVVNQDKIEGNNEFIESIISEACKAKIRGTELQSKKLIEKAMDMGKVAARKLIDEAEGHIKHRLDEHIKYRLDEVAESHKAIMEEINRKINQLDERT